MEELMRVLEKTVSPVQNDQNEAVKFIQDYIQRDFNTFLRALSDVLFEQNNPPVVRAAAGLQLKNQLTARDETVCLQQQIRWRALPDETRNYIKERVFRTLGTEIFKPSSAPQCLAYIAILELPTGQWPGLIQALTQNITNPTSTPQMRLASLEAIGYLCQDIDQSCLKPTDSDCILTAILSNRSDDSNDIKLAAITALVNLSEKKVKNIATTHQTIGFEKLGQLLNVNSYFAERILAQMIREERIKGYLNQVEKTAHFESKDILETFDQDILTVCSEVNNLVEKIRRVVPEEWWAANANQA